MGRFGWFVVLAPLGFAGCDDDAASSRAGSEADAALDVDGHAVVAVDADGVAVLDSSPNMPPSRPDRGLPPEPCNGEPRFCGLTYEDLTYPTTHGAASKTNSVFACPAQHDSVRTQLDQGVRALEFEVFGSGRTAEPASDAAAPAATDAGAAPAASDAGVSGPLLTCAGDCGRGALPLRPALDDVRAFFDVNPREVVTLLVEGGVDAARLEADLRAAGLDGAAWTQAVGAAWPVLNEMIESGKRLVVFADVTGSPPPWMLPLWTFVGATGTRFTTSDAMTCDVERGESSAPLYWINHYLVEGEGGAPCGSEALAHVINAEPLFQTRIRRCADLVKKPTYVAVDFYGDGDVRDITRALGLGE